MKVESISSETPGITYEYGTKDAPEISPNVVIDIGKLYFDSRKLCEPNCYTGLQLTGDEKGVQWMSNLFGDNNELIDYNNIDYELISNKLKLFRKARNSLKNISFKLVTNQIRKLNFNVSVQYVWPKLIGETILFPILQTGHEVIKFITITNPSNEIVVLNYCLHDVTSKTDYHVKLPEEATTKCINCKLTNENVFKLRIGNGEKNSYNNNIIKPKSSIEIGIIFSSNSPGTYSTLLYLRNNLTIIESIWITARTVIPQFKFGNRKPGSATPLLFEISDKHLRDCDRKQPDSDGITVSAKRTFTARNSGEVPIVIGNIKIGGQVCEGYGFKIINCSSFELSPNGSRKIEIAFTPDFTLARVTRILELDTSMGYSVNYTLLSTIPPHALGPCGRALLRPHWEYTIKNISASSLTLALIIVIIAAYLESCRVLRDHVTNISRDKGPLQPPLDLRQLGMRPSTDDTSSQQQQNSSSQSSNLLTSNQTSSSSVGGNSSSGGRSVSYVASSSTGGGGGSTVKRRSNKRSSNGISNDDSLSNSTKSWTSEFNSKLTTATMSNHTSNSKPQILETVNRTVNKTSSTIEPVSTVTTTTSSSATTLAANTNTSTSAVTTTTTTNSIAPHVVVTAATTLVTTTTPTTVVRTTQSPPIIAVKVDNLKGRRSITPPNKTQQQQQSQQEKERKKEEKRKQREISNVGSEEETCSTTTESSSNSDELNHHHHHENKNGINNVSSAGKTSKIKQIVKKTRSLPANYEVKEESDGGKATKISKPNCNGNNNSTNTTPPNNRTTRNGTASLNNSDSSVGILLVNTDLNGSVGSGGGGADVNINSPDSTKKVFINELIILSIEFLPVYFNRIKFVFIFSFI